MGFGTGLRLLAVLAFTALAGGAAHRASATVSTAYTAVDLGSLGGSYSEAFRISDSGQVVGGSLLAGDAAFHAFSWTASTGMADVGTLGGAWSAASDVNAAGTVVGTSNLTGTATGQDIPYHAFAWSAATGISDLGTLGGNWSQATGINTSGEVTGVTVNANGAQRAFVWTETSGMKDLGTLGGSYAQAKAINDSGQVVGTSTLADDNSTHAFIWSPTTGMHDLGSLGGMFSYATDLNDDGQVVGYSYLTGNAAYHAFSWTAAGGMVDIGTLGGADTQASAVSDSGQVVGATTGVGHAFSWTPDGGIRDLGDLSGNGGGAITVDANGRAAGISTGSDSQQKPVFWAAPGATSELGTLGGVYGQPNAANACGQIAGGSDLSGDLEEHATLWQPNTSFVSRCGTAVKLDQQPYRPIGLNIYNANSRSQCWYDMASGTTLDDALTAIGPGKNAIRAWFFQNLATANGQRDWTAFDHTLQVAQAHGVKVIATLGNQWADCEPAAGYKDTNWYSGGYKQPDPGGTVSYRDWVQEVAARYKSDPTILAWQLLNEPEVMSQAGGDCASVPESTAYNLLSSFADDVSTVIKSADPNHLVSLGTIGSGQCGAQAGDFKRLMSIPTLDLCEFHDYNQTDLVPGDQYNGLQTRINDCNALRKPLLVGELGIIPNQVGGSLGDRADTITSKLCAQLTAGGAGMLIWAWDKDGSLLNNYDIGPNDPTLSALAPWSDPSHTCSPPSAPTGVVAAAGAESAAVSWLPPSSVGGSPVRSYTVTASPGNIIRTVTGKATSALVTGLADGTPYTFTVSAGNAAGTGPSSAGSSPVTPTAGSPPPAAASGVASTSATTTVSTGSDPAATGGITSSVTVPPGTSGGTVTVTQSGTGTTAPSGYQFGAIQVDINAPTGTATNPLTLVFTVTPPTGATLDTNTLLATDIYRAEASGSPQPIPPCNGSGVPVDPEPTCVATRQYVTIGGSTYIRVAVSAESASHWNSARPTTSSVAVSNTGYNPAVASVMQGGGVNWTFTGGKPHSATDAAGLGPAGKPLFDSTVKTTGSYSYPFLAAGSYAYKSTVKNDAITGTVSVPMLISHPNASYVLIWATGRITGYAFDVSYRYRPPNSSRWGNWAAWKKGTGDAAATFVPPSGAGTYSFHAHIRNATTGKASGDSPDLLLTIG